MKPVRIPIAAVMALIAVIALELAALRLATEAWVDVTRHLTIATLATATYLARYRRGEEGAWWFGFALSGWAYFALALDAMARWNSVRDSDSVLGLLPVYLLGLFFTNWSEVSKGPILADTWYHRYRILHSMLILVVASTGGLIFWIVARRRGTPYRVSDRRAGRLELEAEN
jgi:hypothetical protein